MSEAYALFDGIIGKMENVADFVVEAGQSNGWTYKKWNSGDAEAWQRWAGNVESYSVNLTEADNSPIKYNFYRDFPLPFTFAEIPTKFATAGVGSGSAFVGTARLGDNTNNVRIFWTSSLESGACVVNVYVRGRWK